MLSSKKTVSSLCTYSRLVLGKKPSIMRASLMSIQLTKTPKYYRPQLEHCANTRDFSTSCQRNNELGNPSSLTSQATKKKAKNLKHEKQSQIPISELIPRCQGCGTPFQHENAKEPGYQQPNDQNDTHNHISFQDKKLEQYHNLYANLGDKAKAIYSATAFEGQNADILKSDQNTPESHEDKATPKEINFQTMPKMIDNHFSSQMFDRKIVNQVKLDKKNAINKGLCQTCRTRKGGSYVDLSEYPHPTSEQVMSRIPENGTIVHVINAQDFPASYIKDIRKYAGDRKVLYVITKSDITVDEHFKNRQRFFPYVLEELKRLDPNFQPENVFVVSAKLKWGIHGLFNSLPADSYIVGLPNTGKSELAHALGSLTKKDDDNGEISLELQQRRFSSSFIPLTTKYPLSYINGGKRITDLPAIEIERLQIYNHIQPEKINSIVSGSVFLRRFGLPAADCHTLTKNGNVLSLGGLVFVRMDNAPPNVHLIFWCTSGSHKTIIRKFGDLETAVKNSANITRVNESWFVNKGYDRNNLDEKEASEVIESLSSTVDGAGSDFSILGFGPLLVQITGPVPPEGVKITFFTKKGIEIHERSQILKYMKDHKPSEAQGSREKRRKVWNGKTRAKKDRTGKQKSMQNKR